MRSSVVIVAHRANPWLPDAIESVREQADEIIVVDNGSPEHAVAEIGRTAGATVVELPANRGFSGGYNAGTVAATGELVGWLNDDAVAGPNWLAAAASVLEDDGVAAVCPKLLFARPHAEIVFDDEPFHAPGDARPLGRQVHSACIGNVDVLPRLVGPGIHQLEQVADGDAERRWRWTAGPLPFYLPLERDWDPADIRIDSEPAPVARVVPVVNNAGSYLTRDGYGGDHGYCTADDGQFDAAADRFAACGAAMVMRRDTLDRVGPLAEHFFLYYEDTDWCWRAQLAGLRIRYDPSAVVHHLGSATTGGLQSTRVRSLSARNRLVCLVRNAPLPVAWSQIRAEMFGTPPVGLERRPLLHRLPHALVERRRLRRGWRRSPADVWEEWAGVGVDWEVRVAHR